jgi:acetylcholinesterase
LKWIQKYISAFGGDPSKVTMSVHYLVCGSSSVSLSFYDSWGESSGAISVALHMLVNKGDHEGLFRGAIMQSGGPIPVGDIEHGQQYYDTLVKSAGCDKSPDTLECLRNIPYERFKYAMDDSPHFLAHQVGQIMLVTVED